MWAQEASPNQVLYIHKKDLGKGQEYTKEPVKRLKNSVVCSPSFTPTPIAKIAPKEYRRVDGAMCYDEPGKLPLTAVVLRDAVYKPSGVFASVRSSPATTSPVRPQQSPHKSPYKVSPQTSKQASMSATHTKDVLPMRPQVTATSSRSERKRRILGVLFDCETRGRFRDSAS